MLFIVIAKHAIKLVCDPDRPAEFNSQRL